VSIALYDGPDAVLGVVYDPMRDEMFTAVEGEGARLNGHLLAVSGESTLERSVVATGFPYDHDQHADELSVVVREVLRRVNGIRRFGSAALDLAWVAAGRYEGYWELGIAPWDGAAGLLLVREAGGRVTDPYDRPSTPFMGLVIATNGHIHEDLRTIVESWMPMRLVDP
jgi:myo-inositol-1(or 4)-monophosphatase